MQNNSTKVIMGESNVNQLSDSFDAVYIQNLLYENSLELVPHGTTYHRDRGSWLDLCIIDQQDTLLEYWKSVAKATSAIKERIRGEWGRRNKNNKNAVRL